MQIRRTQMYGPLAVGIEEGRTVRSEDFQDVERVYCSQRGSVAGDIFFFFCI